MSQDNIRYITQRGFWIIKLSILALIIFIFTLITLFYGYHIRRVTEKEVYDRTKSEMIERYASLQYELRGMSYCYEPRGGQTMEATYVGGDKYRVKRR